MQKKEPELQQSDLDSEITSEINFLQEKIKERPVNRKKLARRTAITVVMAMVFGLVACVTFLLLEPVINKMLYPEEKAQPVSFPEEKQEVKPEDMAADEAELQIIRNEEEAENQEVNESEQGSTAEDNSIDAAAGERESGVSGAANDETEENQANGEEIPSAEAAKALLLENYQQLYGVLGELRAEVEKSIVSVTSVTSDVNWINDTLESTGVTSGLIVADNGRELLIIVGCKELEQADKIFVLFGEEEKQADIKEMDQATGFAVLSVPLSALNDEQRENISYASLGSSAGRALVGQPVMAVGSPMGINGSVCYGMVSSQGAPLGLLDSDYKLLTTDIYGSENASGVLANMQGEIVGILYNRDENSDMENRLCGIGITELKRMIEKLSNGEKMVYLGTYGAEISPATYQEYGLPRGAYLTSIDMDSPAMQAGLQNGDIVTKVDNVDIGSYTEFVSILMKSQVGQNLHFTVARQSQGRGEYQEMTLTVTLQEQK